MPFSKRKTRRSLETAGDTPPEGTKKPRTKSPAKSSSPPPQSPHRTSTPSQTVRDISPIELLDINERPQQIDLLAIGKRGSKSAPSDLDLAGQTASIWRSLIKEPQKDKGSPSYTPPLATKTWHTFGDPRSTEYLKATSNIDGYRIACRYFHARLALVARGFHIDELQQIFVSCLPPFLQDGDEYQRKQANQAFEMQHDWVQDQLVMRLCAYAKEWLMAPAGLFYREQFLLHR